MPAQRSPRSAGRRFAPRAAAVASIIAAAALACGGEVRVGAVPEDLSCGSLNPALLADGGVGRDGIPALVDPALVAPDHESATSYLSSRSRVIAVEVDGEWLAFPHNLMYRHEVVNLNGVSPPLAVTYCPLTGSALAFDRTAAGGAEFGVSGLLFQSNLIMYDRTSDDSLWPQMSARAACGPRAGRALPTRPVLETTWSGFTALFPESRVAAVDPAEADLYRVNPYGSAYEDPNNGSFLGFPIPRDPRRLPKERVLGLPAALDHGPLAFPFHAMDARGATWVREFEYDGAPAVALWDRARSAAAALRPFVGDRRLTLGPDGERGFVDVETGSAWNVAGIAVAGPLAGSRLPAIPEAYVAFWWPWAAFHPDTELVVE